MPTDTDKNWDRVVELRQRLHSVLVEQLAVGIGTEGEAWLVATIKFGAACDPDW